MQERGNHVKANRSAIGRRSLPLVPAMVLAGTAPAGALELGELNVQSRLGQPLRASVAYALGPNEALADYCISLSPANTINGLPAVNRARITVSDGIIAITGNTPIREPLMSARLSIQCPYTPNIARDYMLFIDPAETAEPARLPAVTAPAAPARAPATRPAVTQPAAARPAVNQPAASRPAAVGQRSPAADRNRPAVVSGDVYRVQPGDSLSAIASRLEGREVGLWQAVNAIFVANPEAFIGDDPNRLKAGSLLRIPATAMLADAPATFPAVDAPAASTAQAAVARADDTAYLEPALTAGDSAEPAVPNEAGAAANADREIASDNPFVATGYPDTVLNSAQTATPAEPSPDAADIPEAGADTATTTQATEDTVLPTAADVDTTGRNLIWGGLTGLLAIIAGLLWFRRRRVEPEDTQPEEPTRTVAHPMRRITDDESIEVQVIAQPDDGIDFDLAMLDDDVPTEENPALDTAMLGAEFNGDTVEPDFDIGRASGTRPALDLEIPEGADREQGDRSETDMIPPPHRSAASILESEVLPEEDDDEYDMSVIVDATKMPAPEEATERDLHAVVISDDEEPLTDGSYTLSKEIDYQILEQDYEDELTATQALNREIERAAAELTADLDEEVTVESETLSGDETAALPLTNVTELDVTASMRAGNDDEATDADDKTAEITARLNTDEKTVEMAAAGDAERADDVTTEIEVESGRVGKRAG